MKKVFLSYDLANDLDLYEKFISKQNEQFYPFKVQNHSGIIDNQLSDVCQSIREADLVIMLCGHCSERSENMEQELSCALAHEIPYVFLHGREGKEVTAPCNTEMKETIFSWNRDRIQLLHYQTFLS